LATVPAALAETSAVAVLGQPSFTTNVANYPSGAPSASSLALSNAADVAVAPDGRLYVSDPDNHRILSWPDASLFGNLEAADMVFGQPGFDTGFMNNGGVSASSLALPQGLFVEPNGDLWVCDAFNQRVLRFANPPADATPTVADSVIGQPDFSSNAENFGEGKDFPNDRGLLFPGRVIVRGDDVFIADSGNSRVLRFPRTTENAPTATHVFGQYDRFDRRQPNDDGTGKMGCCANAQNLFNPIGITLDAEGSLYVADWQNHRIVVYQSPLTTDTVADDVIGQPDLFSNEPNDPNRQLGLFLPIDLFVDDRHNLYVADSGNHRIVRIHLLAPDRRPERVYGQLGNLLAGEINHGAGPFSPDADGFFGPTGASLAADGSVIVCDTENQRVLRFPPPTLPAVGDVNCDGAISVGDIGAFVLALTQPFEYASQFPTCLMDTADTNRDGVISVGDIGSFVELLTQ
jgi:sugar lactone lactonase YvrE